jgi:hypothetical protein
MFLPAWALAMTLAPGTLEVPRVAADHPPARRRRQGAGGPRRPGRPARGTLLIDTAGERVGQVNGLSSVQFGRYAFGRPSRITARVRLGRGEAPGGAAADRPRKAPPPPS